MADLDALISDLEAGKSSAADVRSMATFAEAPARLEGHLEAGRVGPVSAPTFLRMVASAGHVDPLITLAGVKNIHRRAAALSALGHSRAAGALGPLTDALQAPVTWVDAAKALGYHGSAAAQDALLTAWRERVGDDWRASIESVRESGETLQLQDWTILASALAHTGASDGLGLVVELSRYGRDDDEGEDVRADAVGALRLFVDGDAVTATLEALNDEEIEVVENAVRCLASYGTPACLPALVDRFELDDEIGEVIEEVIHGLMGDVGPKPQASPSELRRWWMQASTTVSSTQAYWLGMPAEPGRAIDRLMHNVDGGVARMALELWTGIDFVDEDGVGISGDAADRERAEAWWRRVRSTWQVGALYRAGVPQDIGPVVSALVSHAA